MKTTVKPWKFYGSNGDFRLENPHHTSYLYFPLVNEAGMMSSVTPICHGDAKTGQHTFLLAPVSVEDLHNSRSTRNFWVTLGNQRAWSATGSSAQQIAADTDQVTLEAGFLWHKVTRSSPELGLKAEVTNLVPSTKDAVELMRVTLTNLTNTPLRLIPTAAIPIYGRSADNIRDHRNVTSMLHRTRCETFGVVVRPTLSFDERGHHPNPVSYAVLGAEADGTPPAGFFPVVEDFIGEGGTFDWPDAVVLPLLQASPSGTKVDGYESLGGLRFREVTLSPGQSCSYILIMAIYVEAADQNTTHLINAYASAASFETNLERTREYWDEKLANLTFHTGDERFNIWARWLTAQPVLRRLFGCSFLPYHDYGRGGRGWRDLWQDILALMLMETGPVDSLLFGNFAGVRLDGSNATIIGNLPGEFKADRNNIPRVWMDHGAWPLLTTLLYLDQSGDLAFLLRQQSYFKDSHSHRCKRIDPEWQPDEGTEQRSMNGEVYQGSILEHMLLQQLTAFFNVGEHNNIRLEGADWNDGMDMGRQRGESVAFTAFYAWNLRRLSQVVVELPGEQVELAEEILLLLDRISQTVDYDSVEAKNAVLSGYFDRVSHRPSGRKTRVNIHDLASDLNAKADWLYQHLQQHEFIHDRAGFAWFNGYYDDGGQRLEGDHLLGTRMTLTGQVFELMGGVANDEQARQVVQSVEHYLYEPKLQGYRLNTNFQDVLLNMGRCFGYAFGHKENGAMFSHMAVMYAYALYERGFVREGFKVLDGIYRQSVDFAASRMYPGIPEYFSERGRGMYPYLTGSASWYLLALVRSVFGVQSRLGNLVLAPQLSLEQFDEQGEAAIITLFAERKLEIIYQNPERLDHGAYRIKSLRLNGLPLEGSEQDGKWLIHREKIAALASSRLHRLEVTLQRR